MDIILKKKFRLRLPIMGNKANPRTGNSHGLERSRQPSLVPCRRNPAGKAFTPDPLRNMRQMVLHVDGLTGKRRFRQEGT